MINVLVVDNRLVSRKLLVRQLRARGFKAEGAGNGDACLRRLEQEEPPEVILLDLTPPAMSGLEALRHLRLRWPKDLLPVIAVMAARTGSGQVIAALEAGANDCVVKPVDLAVLIARMQVSLDMRRLMVERESVGRSLEAARREAEAANAAKDRFVAVVSHELRAPLMPMLLAAEGLEEDPGLSFQQRERVTLIRRNVELQSRLVNELLDLTRIARGKIELTLAETDAERIVREVLDTLAGELHAKQMTVSLRLRAPDHRVLADPVKLQQVLWNLIQNALKFTPPAGRITIGSASAGRGRLLLKVIDTGIGIEADVLPRIFDPFEQGGRDMTRKYGGLGLGLAISRSLAEAQGGTLEARSAGRGRGTTFTLELPLAASRKEK